MNAAEITFSFWPPLCEQREHPQPTGTMSLADFAERVRDPSKKECETIAAIREAVADDDDDTVDDLKQKVCSATLSGTFRHRKAEKLKRHSGLIVADIDNLPTTEAANAMRDKFAACKHVHFAFISPSGRGVKAVFYVEPVPSNNAEHKVAFSAVTNFCAKEMGTTLDQSGKDCSRLCFISHDPDAKLSDTCTPLPVEDWREPTTDEAQKQRLADILDQGQVDSVKILPPPPEPILTTDTDLNIGEPGNLVTLEGAQKSGKSGVVSALIGSWADPDGSADCLGFRAPESAKDARLLHFDSEQSNLDHRRLLHSAVIKRARLQDLPANITSYSLRRVPIESRLAAVEFAARTFHALDMRVGMIVLDGVADLLVSGPNDEKESRGLVARLEALAEEILCVIVCILHENPGTDYGKTRGHLGSELWRKSQSCIGIEKGADGISTIFGKFLRSGDWPKTEGSFFKWSDEAKMHVTCSDPSEERQRAKNSRQHGALEKLAQAVLPVTALPKGYAEIVPAIEEQEGCSERTAKTRITQMMKAGIIRKTEAGKYEQSNQCN